MTFIAREPVEQIPVYGEEVLWEGGSESGGGTFLSKSVPKPHIFPISEARPYGGVQECLDVANGEPAITRTRRSGALLDVVDDRLCVWLWDEARPMGVVPGALLAMADEGENGTTHYRRRMLACSSLKTCQ